MDYSGGRTGATYSENMMGNHGEAKHAITRSKDLTVSDHYTPEVVLSSAYNSLSVLGMFSPTNLPPSGSNGGKSRCCRPSVPNRIGPRRPPDLFKDSIEPVLVCSICQTCQEW